MAQNKANTLIIDNGSGYIKAGLARDYSPVVYPPWIAWPTEKAHYKDCYIGKSAQNRRDMPTKQAYQRGCIVDFVAMEKLWYFAAQKLHFETEGQTILLTNTPLAPKHERETTTQIMFETFHCGHFFLANQASMTLVASGRTTGVVVDSGDGITHVSPFCNGLVLPTAISSGLELAGSDITDFILAKLQEGNAEVTRETANVIKEQLGYVAPNLAEELQLNPEPVVFMFEGQQISVGNERFLGPESLFSPPQTQGLTERVKMVIAKCDPKFHTAMYNNIVLAGGSTHFLGLKERLFTGLCADLPFSQKVSILAPNTGQRNPWIGASIFASSSNFLSMCVSSAEYDENGPSIIHRKCY